MTEPITPEQLAEWERLAAAATPEPWDQDDTWLVHGRNGTLRETHGFAKFNREQDAAFTAASRTAMPLLIAECRRLEWQVRLYFGVAEEVRKAKRAVDVENERLRGLLQEAMSILPEAAFLRERIIKELEEGG